MGNAQRIAAGAWAGGLPKENRQFTAEPAILLQSGIMGSRQEIGHEFAALLSRRVPFKGKYPLRAEVKRCVFSFAASHDGASILLGDKAFCRYLSNMSLMLFSLGVEAGRFKNEDVCLAALDQIVGEYIRLAGLGLPPYAIIKSGHMRTYEEFREIKAAANELFFESGRPIDISRRAEEGKRIALLLEKRTGIVCYYSKRALLNQRIFTAAGEHLDASGLLPNKAFSAYLTNMVSMLYSLGMPADGFKDKAVCLAALDQIVSEYKSLCAIGVPASIIGEHGHKRPNREFERISLEVDELFGAAGASSIAATAKSSLYNGFFGCCPKKALDAYNGFLLEANRLMGPGNRAIARTIANIALNGHGSVKANACKFDAIVGECKILFEPEFPSAVIPAAKLVFAGNKGFKSAKQAMEFYQWCKKEASSVCAGGYGALADAVALRMLEKGFVDANLTLASYIAWQGRKERRESRDARAFLENRIEIAGRCGGGIGQLLIGSCIEKELYSVTPMAIALPEIWGGKSIPVSPGSRPYPGIFESLPSPAREHIIQKVNLHVSEGGPCFEVFRSFDAEELAAFKEAVDAGVKRMIAAGKAFYLAENHAIRMEYERFWANADLRRGWLSALALEIYRHPNTVQFEDLPLLGLGSLQDYYAVHNGWNSDMRVVGAALRKMQ